MLTAELIAAKRARQRQMWITNAPNSLPTKRAETKKEREVPIENGHLSLILNRRRKDTHTPLEENIINNIYKYIVLIGGANSSG